MANYYEQCNCGAYCDETPCERCRQAKASSPGPSAENEPTPCPQCGGKGERRPRSEILAARRTVYGCCDRHADNSACDCLMEPCCGACNGTGKKPT